MPVVLAGRGASRKGEPYSAANCVTEVLSSSMAGMLLALLLLNTSVTQLAALYGSPFRLLPLPASTTGMLLAGSAALGVLGAALSVRRFLRQPS